MTNPLFSRGSRNVGSALAFLLPNLLGFLCFTFFPVLFSLAMAFTNWSLKPSVPTAFVGLRNFGDLLGARPIAPGGQPEILAAFVVCAIAVLAGSGGALWAHLSLWRGARTGAVIVAVAGAVFAILGVKGGVEAVVFLSLAALIAGGMMTSRAGAWRVGVGTVPAILLAIGAAGMWGLRRAITAAYEPSDPYFYQYFYNTVYLMIGIPFSIGGSLALALLLHEELPVGAGRQRIIAAVLCVACGVVLGGILGAVGGANLGLLCFLLWAMAALGFAGNVVAFRTLFYLPTFTAGVAMMILWQALYNPKTGPINVGIAGIFHLLSIHADPPQWLGDVAWAKPALIVMGVWTGIGGMNMLLYLAGLSNLPQELIDAAQVDGAGRWDRFVHVVWPQLAPTTFFISIMAIIGGLQGGFEQARVMTNGGPAGSTTTLSYYIYNKAFQDLDMGYAAAISWVLFLIVFAVTALNWKFGRGLETEG